jgi:hypothetical protein
VEDLRGIKDFHYIKLGGLSDPDADPEAWHRVMRDFPVEWHELVMTYLEYDSPICDRPTASSCKVVATTLRMGFKCDLCGDDKAFKSQKDLDTHKRVKHKCRTAVDEYVGFVSICPICNKDFHCRPRLLCHLSETRIRSKHRSETCRSILLSGNLPKVANAELEKARSHDRKLRHEARRCGNTHVIANKPVYRSCDVSIHTAQRDAGRQLKRKSPADKRPMRRLRAKTSASEVTFVVVDQGTKRPIDD